MAEEIERKFLVKGDFWHLATEKKEIIQAYISVDPDRIIRIRIENGKKASLGIKSLIKGKFFRRNEWEIPLSLESANELMDICLPGRIIKTRYLVPSDKHVFEIDVFHDKNEGLILAEIELSDENEYFLKPDWLGEEVSGNPYYYNSNMIK